MRKRKAELDAIFKKLYEDSVLGRITTEQFQMLSGSYTEEQNRIAAGIPQQRDGDPTSARNGEWDGQLPR
ncbi:MAG: hypothetical protein ACLUIW_12085 [Dysosmobacter welbionis]